jgi:hypothetical protein
MVAWIAFLTLADITTRIRSKLNKKADLRHAIPRDNSADLVLCKIWLIYMA